MYWLNLCTPVKVIVQASKKFPSEGHFVQPFLCKAKWSSCHIIIKQRLLNSKVESVGFVRAVPKRARKWVDVESLSQNVKLQHFGLAKRPELSQKDKNIQTEVMSLSGKCDKEKVQIFVFKCREEKEKYLEK